ncbi:HAD-IIIA family hydrolase [Shimia sp. Alg240-R146]|uniref:HAD-IIIA family hydrolase n=1 Tax=Shimia sp. Alg240-R146 TaxID=2993449 RepID=UPI0022E752A9|nr:HAD-IIIA family hydrolase [Shimia sp. Alg240-R146]
MHTIEKHSIAVALLLGGKGTRLGLDGIPKPMVEVLGTPLLEHHVVQLRDQGFTNLVFLTGYQSNVIEAHFGDGSKWGVQISYSVEEEPLGTARATCAALPMLGNEFVLLYGDVVCDVDIARFVEQSRENGGHGTLVVHPNDHPHDSDLVVTDPDSPRIAAFLNKPHAEDLRTRNLVNAGLYYLKPDVFEAIPEGEELFDWGRDVFPKAVADGYELYAYRSAEYMKDIGTPARLQKAQRHILSGSVAARSMRNPQRAVFLDRDGVINREINGVHKPDDMQVLPAVGSTIASINQSPFLTIGITNQPDLAKGFFGFEDLDAVHAEMDRQLVEDHAFLDDLLFCPHHPETGFDGEVAALKRVCTCRKPAPGMLLKAAQRYNIDLSRSYMVGDRLSDLVAAEAAGAIPVLVHRNGEKDLPKDARDAHPAKYVAIDLASAWEWIKEDMSE